MIEQAMILALGFLLAGLLVLLLLPAFWARAVRLSLRRLERQLPISMEEVAADRDRLRAENAVTNRRIEQTAERIARAHALDRAELGRGLARIKSLEARNSDQAGRIDDLEEALRLSRDELARSDAERSALDKVLYDSSGLLDRKDAALQDITEAFKRLNQRSEERRATIAALETFAEATQARSQALEERLRASEASVHKKTNEMQIAMNAREAAAAETAFMQARVSVLQTRVDAQREQIADLDAARIMAEQARDAASNTIVQHQATIQRREQTVVDVRTQMAELAEKLARAQEAGRNAERELLMRLETLRAQRDAAVGGLEAARRARDGLPRSDRVAQVPRPREPIASPFSGARTEPADGAAAMDGAAPAPDEPAPRPRRRPWPDATEREDTPAPARGEIVPTSP